MSEGSFRSHIRAAIADPQLQLALDANAQRRASGRKAAFISVPDWQERRMRAHAVRGDVIESLHELLSIFSERATHNGMHVHRAADAAHALSLVVKIAEGAQPATDGTLGPRKLLFAKSKSMVSEEIELNAALESRGHRVVETDLGEYIVQLRGEKPAHIITPAVHLLRRQVGELFRDRLGLGYTEDIPALTEAARRVLREVFLTADIGISGVNFGVAETGGLCIVTNEGNGRMVTTMPRVHIALMGMERLVPTLDDLALMLSLLPRSATGQKLSVYTQLIHSPRREDELDGALERHVIIVDNGRSRLWNSDLKEALYCIRCGACLNACPVFREIGGHAYVAENGDPAPYPGPIGSVISPGLGGLMRFGHLAQASSLCGACKDACPVDIDLPTMLTKVRAGSPETRSGSMGTGLSAGTRAALGAYTWVASKPRLFEAMQRLGSLGARIVSPKSEWMRLPAFTGWGFSKDMLRPAARTFRERWGGLAGETSALPTAARIDNAAEPDLEPESTPDPASQLAEELAALGAVVETVKSVDLPSKLTAIFRDRGIQRVLTWDRVEGLSASALEAAGVELVKNPDDKILAGITGCTCAIAATGTLLLTSGAGKPLSTSLLPEIHVVILQASQIVASVEEALQIMEVRDSGATVLITGPSRTADIEMTLTIGVHGPKELLVYIVE
jgi:L-lactate dehydrogenase complex protein LldF